MPPPAPAPGPASGEGAERPTVWVLGDQLNRNGRPPGRPRARTDCRVLIVESEAKLRSKRWHLQRAHLVLSAMAHFADELRAAGYEVDHRRAADPASRAWPTTWPSSTSTPTSASNPAGSSPWRR